LSDKSKTPIGFRELANERISKLGAEGEMRKKWCLGDFVANNVKITNQHSFSKQKAYLLNNQIITTITATKTAWSHLEGRAKAYRRQSEG